MRLVNGNACTADAPPAGAAAGCRRQAAWEIKATAQGSCSRFAEI